MSQTADFKAHLERQLGFLERSCASYDQGYTDEAIRIAVVTRVLIHNTSSSTSLLRHLDASSIALLSTTFEPSQQTVSFIGMGMMRVGGRNSEYYPHLGNGPIANLLDVATWWNQTVMVLDSTRMSRRDVVLAAANKDGGAHVDSRLTSEYEALATDGAVGSFVYGRDESKADVPIKDAHLVTLRQIGYELLNSPDLLSLAGGQG